MAIIRGYPTSDTIQEGIRLPKIVKKRARIYDLQYGDRFIYRGDEHFMLMAKQSICYRSKDESMIGSLLGYCENVEVVHLFQDWTWTLEDVL